MAKKVIIEGGKTSELQERTNVTGEEFVVLQEGGKNYKAKAKNLGGSQSGVSSYTELTEKPQIGGVELSGNKTPQQLGLQPKMDGSTTVATINGQTIPFGGNVQLPGEGGGPGIVVDPELNPDSTNAIQNKAVAKKLTELEGINDYYSPILDSGITAEKFQSKPLIKIVKSEDGQSFHINISRIFSRYHNNDFLLKDVLIRLSHNYSYDSEPFNIEVTRLYIGVDESTRKYIVTDDLSINSKQRIIYLCMMYSYYDQWYIIDSRNLFSYEDISNAANYFKRYNINMFGIQPYTEETLEKKDMSKQLNAAILLAADMGLKSLYFPKGIYYISKLELRSNLNYIAEVPYKTIFQNFKDVSEYTREANQIIDNMENGALIGFTLKNIDITEGANHSRSCCRNVYMDLFYDFPLRNSGYVFYRPLDKDSHHVYDNITINVNHVFTGIGISDNTIVRNCKFKGSFTHAIEGIGVSNCHVYNNSLKVCSCTQGIFFGTNGKNLSKNNIVRYNYVSGCAEECISMDGFGNNWDGFPNRGHGNIKNKYLNEEGFLVIEAENLKAPGPKGVAEPTDVSSLNKDDIIFYFGSGTGIDGQYYPILEIVVSEGSNKFILSTKSVEPSNINIGTDSIISLATGFLNCIVEGNTIEKSDGYPGDDKAVAISMFLNVFGCSVLNNSINGVSRGIHFNAGKGINDCSLFYSNNVISGNKINGCKFDALDLLNRYTGSIGFNNIVTNNIVSNCGIIEFEDQKGLLVSNNIFRDVNLSIKRIDDSFITNNLMLNCHLNEEGNGSNYVRKNNSNDVN